MAQLVQHLPRTQKIAGSSPARGSSSFSLEKKELSSGVVACICLVSITDYSCIYQEVTSATRHQPHCTCTCMNTQWLLAGVGQGSLVEAEEVERLKQVFPLLSVQSNVCAHIKPWVKQYSGFIICEISPPLPFRLFLLPSLYLS